MSLFWCIIGIVMGFALGVIFQMIRMEKKGKSVEKSPPTDIMEEKPE